jgi:aspartyl-tRNA(Asn)/glutamyl-tRNA(Gln) amidotransferase subunit A
MTVPEMTLIEAAKALRAGQTSSSELTEEYLKRIEELNPRLNAFLTVTADIAREQALQADRERRSGMDRGPLHGIPIAHKDLFCTAGVRTTSGSKLFEDFVPKFDAAVVERLREAGAVMLGKTSMHEHAYGITCDNPHFGAVHNPWDLDRIPGGSSGGSAVAVAAGLCLMGTGSDTGGSIRVPSSYCGVTGIKPTFGLVSKYGALPLGFSLDHVGPIARTVRDVAVSLAAMAGPDRRDPNSARHHADTLLPPDEIPSLAGVRIGVPTNFFFDRVEMQVDNAVHFMAYRAQDLGAELVALRVPDGRQLNTISQITLLVEAAAVHEPYIRKQRKLYGDDVKALIDMGRVIPGVDYVQAQRLRRRAQGVYNSILKQVDCLLVPATPFTAPNIGQTEISVDGEMEDVRIATTRLVRGMNALGLPSLAMPAGFTQSGMPIGMQLIGRPFGERELLRIGAAIEDATGHVRRRPKLEPKSAL